MIQQQPAYQTGSQPTDVELVLPVTVTADDAIKLAEFIVLAIEARRKDDLKRLDFHLEVKERELWVLPANDTKVVAFEKSAV